MRVAVARLIRMWMREGEEIEAFNFNRPAYRQVDLRFFESVRRFSDFENRLYHMIRNPFKREVSDVEIRTNQRTITAHHHAGRTWIWDSDMPELEPRRAVAPFYDHNPLDDPWADGWRPPD
jgi:hypothetical protein